jgi:CheY-like chemotaxis protein
MMMTDDSLWAAHRERARCAFQAGSDLRGEPALPAERETDQTLTAAPESREEGDSCAGYACVSEAPVATKTILIVDDDLPFAEALDDLLKDAGYRTVVAKNGEEAGVELEINPPDLILTDVFMPVINGFAFCHMVRANDATRNTPIVVMSAMPNYHYTIPVRINGFLLKPFDMYALLHLVVSLVEEPPLEKQVGA